MNAIRTAPAASRLLLSGNEAIARAVWEAGTAVAAAYPGTPATEILETLAFFPDVDTHWAVNEKVSLEVAIGASLAGARGFCAMKHVGLNVAADALMSQTLAGARGGLVIAVADDVGLSSSQNEQDSRFWGRFAHVPILEPADSQEAYDMTKRAFEISERFEVPVLVRLTTRVCHVKALCTVGERQPHAATGFHLDPNRWVLTPATARRRLPKMFERDQALAAYTEECDLTVELPGEDRKVGFVASGPAALAVREAFPDAPLLKLGMSHPLPIGRIRKLAWAVDTLVVVEEIEPIAENEIRAAGIACHGKDALPRSGELAFDIVRPAVRRLLGEETAPADEAAPPAVFPRPPTMCVGCPHLAPYYVLARMRKNVLISGDIGCYTLGAGHPWNALDTTVCMGASMGIALGIEKGKGAADKDKGVVAVIGDSTFLHMGMQGLLDITYNRGNITVLLLDNRAVGMTGGQDHPGTGRDIRGQEAPKIDFAQLVEALGVKKERIHVVNPYELPVLSRTLRQEMAVPEPSVIITNQPCVLIDRFQKMTPFAVEDDQCNGCSSCLRVGCPAILVSRRETSVAPNGKEKVLNFVTIDTAFCTGCNLCVNTCGPGAIVPAATVSKGDRR
ncbi:MAG: indolepyruvate ferredoxin oxidoreductase [Rhodospirillales bacterium]|nr:indolepyruvate ferredoxin oxidoreductase [Rhodospirillales bacterium]